MKTSIFTIVEETVVDIVQQCESETLLVGNVEVLTEPEHMADSLIKQVVMNKSLIPVVLYVRQLVEGVYKYRTSKDSVTWTVIVPHETF